MLRSIYLQWAMERTWTQNQAEIESILIRRPVRKLEA